MSYNMFIRIFFGTVLQLEVYIAITESSTISEDTMIIHVTEILTYSAGFSPHKMSMIFSMKKAGHMLQIAYYQTTRS